MRLSDEQVASVKSVLASHDPEAQIYLFGSRVDDSKRGGDIDLLVLSSKLNLDDRRAIKLELYRKIGHQKIDILLSRDSSKPFVQLAMEEGIKL